MEKIVLPYSKIAQKDEIIEWVFENTKKRFCYDTAIGHTDGKIKVVNDKIKWTWFFEDEDDAMKFKVVWG